VLTTKELAEKIIIENSWPWASLWIEREDHDSKTVKNGNGYFILPNDNERQKKNLIRKQVFHVHAKNKHNKLYKKNFSFEVLKVISDQTLKQN
jgi:hypothetical protein